MLIHDIIKIKYVKLGYFTKNYPYHMISDEEMFNAFIDLGNEDFNKTTTVIDPDTRFFDSYYPNPFAEEDMYYEKKNAMGEVVAKVSLSSEYGRLVSYIKERINDYLAYCDTMVASEHQLPAWIYTYMLGEVVYQQSDYYDVFDILAMLKCSNLDNEFTPSACAACYVTSLGYISTLTKGSRPPTVFGEPHVIKQLRLGV